MAEQHDEMGRVTALRRHRRIQQILCAHHDTSRTGGQPRATNRISHDIEESHNDVVHQVPALDRLAPAGLIWIRSELKHSCTPFLRRDIARGMHTTHRRT